MSWFTEQMMRTGISEVDAFNLRRALYEESAVLSRALRAARKEAVAAGDTARAERIERIKYHVSARTDRRDSGTSPQAHLAYMRRCEPHIIEMWEGATK